MTTAFGAVEKIQHARRLARRWAGPAAGDHENPSQAYSSRAIRQVLRRRCTQAVIPERADQKANRLRRGQTGGRPPAFDRELYKARNVVERSFNRLKQFRTIATRFDKLATRYKAGVHLAAIILWLREPTQNPSSDRS